MFDSDLGSHGAHHVRHKFGADHIDLTNVAVAHGDYWRQKLLIKAIVVLSGNFNQSKCCFVKLARIDIQKVVPGTWDSTIVGYGNAQVVDLVKSTPDRCDVSGQRVFGGLDLDFIGKIREFFVDLFVETVELFI